MSEEPKCQLLFPIITDAEGVHQLTPWAIMTAEIVAKKAEIEAHPRFKSWAKDPITGEIFIKISWPEGAIDKMFPPPSAEYLSRLHGH